MRSSGRGCHEVHFWPRETAKFSFKSGVTAINDSPDIHLHQVTLAYADGLMVDKLDVKFPAASLTCLLGPSGIGKSTLLRYIAGLTGPEIISGSISCSDNLPLAGRVGWLPQEPMLLPWLNVVENVCIGARLRKQMSAQASEAAHEILASVGLGEALHKYPAELSGGMQSRTALARTLFEDQPVVLMDEPFSAIDAISRNRLQTLATKLLHGRTVILVTHDPYEALRVADRIHVLNGQPATLTEALIPPGQPPRDSSISELNSLHAKLMQQLDVDAFAA